MATNISTEVRHSLRKHGWIVTGVPGKAFYTIGLLDRFDHPELAIHGLSPERSGGVLHAAYASIENGNRLDQPNLVQPGVISSKSGLSMDIMTLAVDPSNFPDWFGQALGYYQADLKMIQLLWPDREGRFPGNPDFDEKFKHQLRFDVRRPEYND